MSRATRDTVDTAGVAPHGVMVLDLIFIAPLRT